MLKALKQYLEAMGYSHIYCDYVPDVSSQLQAIILKKWGHTVGAINDGTGTHYIQILCRDSRYEDAQDTCNKIFKLLDSGTEEHVIHLTDGVFCIARPRRGALLMERGSVYHTFYCEIALWGEN